jgi:malonyl-CoA/methylmalonyl-CoA synthetase
MESLQDAFDLDGFFRTGDLVKRQGGNYVTFGRSLLDCETPPHIHHVTIFADPFPAIRFAGYTMTTLSIETALYSLPYISHAIVLGIEDETYHQRVAAIISTKVSAHDFVNLETLHKDLEVTNLAKYKYPTVVYWLGKEEALPMSSNGKVPKKIVKERFFGVGYEESRQIEVANLEMEDWDVELGEGRRAWE